MLLKEDCPNIDAGYCILKKCYYAPKLLDPLLFFFFRILALFPKLKTLLE